MFVSVEYVTVHSFSVFLSLPLSLSFFIYLVLANKKEKQVQRTIISSYLLINMMMIIIYDGNNVPTPCLPLYTGFHTCLCIPVLF